MTVPVFKILRAEEWAEFEAAGQFAGSPDDIEDGFVHLSAADQVAGTRSRRFSGVAGLVLLTLDADTLGDALRWEPSRAGAVFPHLYRPIERAEVVAVERL
jgi:uncharacterized protein (DUF952 family)